MKKKMMVFLCVVLVLVGTTASYKVIAKNEMRNKTYDFLETKGYTENDVLDLEIKHSFVNKLLSYNEWRIFVTFKSEPAIIFAFTYHNDEIIRQGTSSTPMLDKDEILDYENKFDNGELSISEQSEQRDLIPMVMVNGELYLDTGLKATSERKCGTMDGKITSEVNRTEKPTKDNESNFGTGYKYQYGSQEGTIEIYMNGKWWIFATQEARQQIQFPEDEVETISFHEKTFNKSELSQETIEWLE